MLTTIYFDGPKLTHNQKRSLIHGITQVASQASGIPMAAFDIILDEHESSNMGVGGELLNYYSLEKQNRINFLDIFYIWVT